MGGYNQAGYISPEIEGLEILIQQFDPDRVKVNKEEHSLFSDEKIRLT